MSDALTTAVAELFAREIDRLWAEARKPVSRIDCPVCGRQDEIESRKQPGRCWLFCEEE